MVSQQQVQMLETMITVKARLGRRTDTTAARYLGANVTSTAACHHDQDITNQKGHQRYARIETQRDAC